MKISEKSTFSPSAFARFLEILALKRGHGVHVYKFFSGDPVLPNHQAIVDAAYEAIRSRVSPYPSPQGILELRNLAAQQMNLSFHSNFENSETLVTCGGKHALYLALQALVNPKEEVLIHSPYWPSFPDTVSLVGGKPKIIPAPKTGFKLTVRELEKAASSNTKALIFSNGGNPTGLLYTKKEVAALLEFAAHANMAVIAIEAYSNIVYDNAEYISCSSFRDFRNNVVIIQSCSKNYGMTGWRVGFVFGPREMIQSMTYAQSLTTTGTAWISQFAAMGALKHADSVSRYVCDHMKARRDLFAETFAHYFHQKLEKPASGLYFFVPLATLGIRSNDSISFCEKALEEASVGILPGALLGCEGYVRLSFTETEGDIVKGLRQLSDFIS